MVAPALFIGAHPDDLYLAMGGAICKHLAASPAQDLYVLLLTRGTASSVLDKLNGVMTSSYWNNLAHDPEREGYEPLTPEVFGLARLLEEWSAMGALRTGLPGELTMLEAQLSDGSVTTTDAKTAILSLCDEIAPDLPVRLKTHTYLGSLEDHPDHRAAGNAVKELADEDATRFSDRRFYIMPNHWTDNNLSSVSYGWELPNSTTTPRVKNAAGAFRSWNPMAVSYAIGAHSVSSLINTVESTQKSLYHLP